MEIKNCLDSKFFVFINNFTISLYNLHVWKRRIQDRVLFDASFKIFFAYPYGSKMWMVLIKMIPTSKRILRPPPISGLSIDATTSYGGGYLELVFRFCMSNQRNRCPSAFERQTILGQYSGEIEGLLRATECRKLLCNIELNSHPILSLFLSTILFLFLKTNLILFYFILIFPMVFSIPIKCKE